MNALKKTLFFVFLLSGIYSCSDDEAQTDGYQIRKHEIVLFPNQESVEFIGTDYMYPYMDETTGEKVYYITFKGYFMLGLSGRAYNIPDNIQNLEIPHEGIKVSVSGEAKPADYFNIPEVKSIDFYCSTINVVN
ncbi:hypothetical protein CLV62_11086 [Dysgonomonas alginatilytica]|uniref:Uncharacterized protein n=1 Tax=Dysgonomonas alginatilytica TaxID=1605892 RepID=A0A2V3PQQ4_9BACT|nr:hypothetical protein [Dysgonomonas alginatilytica]PXV64442.1 hypothetical protein CLV62_11086 [Dysgonomonas alginatilytica]